MYLIAGLGNPDKKYDMTRHNIGFDAVDMISREFNAPIKKIKFKAVYGETDIMGEKVILAKPQTYMNLSGESIREIASFYKIKPQNIIIFHDDISLPVGKVRIRKKGSDGGHNGLKSIIYQLVSDDFVRVKIGVGAPANKDYDLADYVLGHFSKEEQPLMKEGIEKAMDAISMMLEGDIDGAMNKFNRKVSVL